MNKFINFVLCMSMCMVLFACGRDSSEYFSVEDIKNTEVSQNTEVPEVDKAENIDTVCVYICGAVKKPGVYNFPAGARIVDAIQAAGGYVGEADEDFWNQAQQMSDGMMIYVPTVDENMSASESGGMPGNNSQAQDDGRININTAGKEELMSLSGIGQSKAESIITYRTEHGEFTSIEDILLVSGIGNSLFEKIREYITVN